MALWPDRSAGRAVEVKWSVGQAAFRVEVLVV